MNRRRYSTIAHRKHQFASPTSPTRAEMMVRALPTNDPPGRLLDIGAGFGPWSSLALDCGFFVTAVEPNADFVARGRDRDPRIEWSLANYDPAAYETGMFDAALCIGSSHAVGTQSDAMIEVIRLLRPKGRALVGEGYWRRTPDQAYLRVLGATADEMTTFDGLVAEANSHGLVVDAQEASVAEWDDYENLYRNTMLEWLAANLEDKDAPAFEEQCERWFEAYDRWGRLTLGFAYLLLEKR